MSAHHAPANGQKSLKDKKITRILIVDDHAVVREGLASIFEREADLLVCGQAEDRHQALHIMAKVRIDLVVLDLELKNSHGFDLIKDLRAQYPKAQILVVTMHDEKVNATRVIRAGASGYITKDEATIKIVDAVRQILRGEVYLSPKLSVELISKLAGRLKPEDEAESNAFTDRELQILQIMGDGFNRRETATKLNLDVNTVETYRYRLREKLKLKTGSELLQFAIKFKRSRL